MKSYETPKLEEIKVEIDDICADSNIFPGFEGDHEEGRGW